MCLVRVASILQVVRAGSWDVLLFVLVHQVSASMHVHLGALVESARNRVRVGAGLRSMTLCNETRSVLTSETPLSSILFGAVGVGIVLAWRSLKTSLLLSCQVLSHASSHLEGRFSLLTGILVGGVGAWSGFGSLLFDVRSVACNCTHACTGAISTNHVLRAVAAGAGHLQFRGNLFSSSTSKSKLGCTVQNRLFVLVEGAGAGLHLIFFGASDVTSRSRSKLHRGNTVRLVCAVVARAGLEILFVESDVLQLATHRILQVSTLLLIGGVAPRSGPEHPTETLDLGLSSDRLSGTLNQLIAVKRKMSKSK